MRKLEGKWVPDLVSVGWGAKITAMVVLETAITAFKRKMRNISVVRGRPGLNEFLEAAICIMNPNGGFRDMDVVGLTKVMRDKGFEREVMLAWMRALHPGLAWSMNRPTTHMTNFHGAGTSADAANRITLARWPAAYRLVSGRICGLW